MGSNPGPSMNLFSDSRQVIYLFSFMWLNLSVFPCHVRNGNDVIFLRAISKQK